MNFDFSWIHLLAAVSIVIYFTFQYFDGKALKDEREELIRLKTYELMQRLTIGALCGLAALLFFFPGLPAGLAVLILVLSTMYGEIFGKIYYRRRL